MSSAAAVSTVASELISVMPTKPPLVPSVRANDATEPDDDTVRTVEMNSSSNASG
jgi:hypothetical protein